MSKDTDDTTQLPHVKQDFPPQKGIWGRDDYLCTCPTCRGHFWGDKRSTTCADCEGRASTEEVEWVDGGWAPVTTQEKSPDPVEEFLDEMFEEAREMTEEEYLALHARSRQLEDPEEFCTTCDNRERDGLSSPCLVCMDYCNYVEEDRCTTE